MPPPGQTPQRREEGGLHEAGRNKRSVWEITTQPYPEAHFATFPPKLVEPCILAGSAPNALVLDPFAGAGTTGLVAAQHGRDFVGIELNPEYAEMARERIRRYEANPAGALEGDPEPIEGQVGLFEVEDKSPAVVKDKQGQGGRTYAGFNERWKNRTREQ